MSRFIYIISFGFLLVFISCASESNTVNPVVEFKPKFELSVNGVAANFDFIESGYATDNIISFGNGYATILFDKSGRFGSFALGSHFYSFRGFSSHYFNFKLESIDEVDKRVKASFSGYLYADPLDVNSEKKFVTGSFDTKYEELIPAFSGVKNQAKINGKEWSRTNQYYTSWGASSYENKIQHDLSDDEYKIMINYKMKYGDNGYDTAVGTYNFSNTDLTNKVQLAKFDIQTASFINYTCNGTLTMTYAANRLLVGTYNFIAINPLTNESIPVTDGVFKLFRPF